MSELELRDEPQSSATSRALLEAYERLVRERLAEHGVAPGLRFFAVEDLLDVWLVGYAGGRPVGCGGLCSPAPQVGEVKRLFVVGSARGRGYGRALLRELERRGRERGLLRMRMVTAEPLHEASALYAAAGYEITGRAVPAGGPRELELEKALHS